jgi:hypothetical protein
MTVSSAGEILVLHIQHEAMQVHTAEKPLISTMWKVFSWRTVLRHHGKLHTTSKALQGRNT